MRLPLFLLIANGVPVMLVRAAAEDDVSALGALMGELGYPTADDEMAERFAKVAGREDIGTFVAELDGAIAGMIGVSVMPTLYRTGLAGAITALVVDPDYRGRGIAPALVEAGEAWLRMHGADRVSVMPSKARIGAHRLYERVGYAHTGSRFTKAL